MTDTNLDILSLTDPAIAGILQKELQRQRDHLELIASENFTSAAVMAAQGSVLTTNTPKDCPKNATMAVANTLTKRNN